MVQYGADKSFKCLPSQAYLMMILQVCHVSFAFKLEDVATMLDDLTLVAFPGENVSKFANEAQRLIKILKGGYALPYQLGSSIIQKVSNTQSTYFNRTMFNLLDHVLAMENSHWRHKGPKLLEANINYAKLGPLGVCKEMREIYADQVRMKVWLALATKIPQANIGKSKRLGEDS